MVRCYEVLRQLVNFEGKIGPKTNNCDDGCYHWEHKLLYFCFIGILDKFLD